MSFTFDVIDRNEVDIRSVAADASMYLVRRNDTVRLIWSESIMPKIFEKGFIQKLITSDAHTAVFSFDVPFDQTIAWSDQRHIAIFQSFEAVADKIVRCVPWQIRVEFSQKVRPYIHVHSALLKELDVYLGKSGWRFTTTDEGFLLIPLNVYDELEKTHEMYVTYWEMCKSARGPSVTDLSWGDNEFKSIVAAAEPRTLWTNIEGGVSFYGPLPVKKGQHQLFPSSANVLEDCQDTLSRTQPTSFRSMSGGGGSNAAAGAAPE
jgi:hypothetical protein